MLRLYATIPNWVKLSREEMISHPVGKQVDGLENMLTRKHMLFSFLSFFLLLQIHVHSADLKAVFAPLFSSIQ